MNFFKRLSPKRYYAYKAEVENRNLIASGTFLLVGFIVATVNMLSNVFIRPTNGFLQSMVLLVYFGVATIIRRYVVRDNIKRTLVFLYLVQIPVMVFGMLMGTVWDPKNLTITFFLLIICMPPFILDNPIRHFLYITSNMGLYLILAYVYKDRTIFELDAVHALSFYMGSIFVSMFVLAERFDNIENYIEVEIAAEHDPLSGLKNRYALMRETESFIGKEVYAAFFDIENFRFYNDMYGHQLGQDVFNTLGKFAVEVFGEEHCYRFESDEILVLDTPENEEIFLNKLGDVKRRFGNITVKNLHFHPSCNIGYVYGIPQNVKSLDEIIRHADVRLIEAKNGGHGAIVGYEFDMSKKRQTDILSEVGMYINRASLDELTGLPNMQFFRFRADEMLRIVIDKADEPVFIYYNIGNFKSYNEENGFRRGDKLLQEIATVLKQEFAGALISRFSGDHFVILTNKKGIENKLDVVNQKIEPLFGNIEMNIKCGIYEYTDEEDVGIACDKAKLACDSIKREFNTKYAFYDSVLENRNKLQQYIITHIDEAVDNDYLKVYYQPIIDVKTGKVVELEALARWIDPVHGFLSPGDFIPVLEESRLIYMIDTFIARQICVDQKVLEGKVGHTVPISINLSRLDFVMVDVLDIILQNAQEFKINKGDIHIEITESALEDDSEDLIKKINSLRDAGFEVWLDDFGSGYSSLNSLKDFNFDVIKVDMGLIRSLDDNPNTSVVVKSVVDMVKNLGLKSLVEGIETKEQYNFLKEIGADLAQGYLFSRPVPIDELEFDEIEG